MKARKVKALDPAGPVGDNMERIVRVRLAELCDFMPRAANVEEVETLHDMRIAAKRLRYILEITASCFGPYAGTAVKLTKELQDLLGEIHDCDVQVEEIQELVARLSAQDAAVLAGTVQGADELTPRALRRTPNRKAYSGLSTLGVYLRARRELLFTRFLDMWRDMERKGFRARLEYAARERPVPPPDEPSPDATAQMESGAVPDGRAETATASETPGADGAPPAGEDGQVPAVSAS